jgi:fumarate reductase (CoM/CoB) subunit B
MHQHRDMLRFCACCPNPCRRAIPANHERQVESETPSALALIGLSLIDGRMEFDADVNDMLSHTEMARLCRTACPYDHDIAGAIDDLRKHYGSGT